MVETPTREDAKRLFDAVIEVLRDHGWKQHRVDTLVHDANEGKRDRWTVRHQYVHGEWELHYEQDRNYVPAARRVSRTVRIRATNGRLPSINEVLSELFGTDVRLYFPKN